ncbi:MAG TPA: enoyl-CoA hydratase/isomerase family protein [Dehalococcoidia bacterium]|nr:enoyl-CoA hydratase/isomerase family protein [Dehalococcoidia bacterium]
MADEALVRVERDGARGELVLNRPHRKNALTRPLVEELHAGLDELAADDDINAILIRGEGGAFCGGLDLKARRDEPEVMENFGPTWASYHAAVYACPTPIIGALEGPAIAAGSGLALSCDFLIAGEGARLHASEVRLGRLAPLNLIWLQLKFGAATAMEVVVGGQPFTGVELVARGIAVRVVADADVVTEARAYADAIAENDAGAMASAKATLRDLNGVDDFHALIVATQQS